MEFSKNNYFGYILKGDLIGALNYIKQFPEQMGLYKKYMTISEQEEYISYPLDADLNDILLRYQQYYRDVFFLRLDNEGAADRLRIRFMEYLEIKDKRTALSDIEDQIAEIFKHKGFHFLGGKTSGYYGPYIWKSIETKIFEVELPKGNQSYRVDLLDGFVTKSWLDYLSFGEIGTGGWTNGDGIINCIKFSYDFDSENFKVSLLRHEAQHARDLSILKNISTEELEYRAKLVEMIYSKERNLLETFSNEADESAKNNSHSLASNRIVEGFIKKSNLSRAEFNKLSIEQIQSIAKALFEENEKSLD